MFPMTFPWSEFNPKSIRLPISAVAGESVVKYEDPVLGISASTWCVP